MEQDYQHRHAEAKNVYQSVVDGYMTGACPCAFPRFRQITGINCVDSGDSYCCFDTELLIALIKPFFDISPSDRKDECTNEKWVCKTCGSEYEWGWSDFSIHVNRQKLALTNLRASVIGKAAGKPIPLYLGLFGHSYPPPSEMRPANLEEMAAYLNER
ncbi:MAG: hypothetical protein IT259_14650 [Saprospiraceae bacterium]|nr:hypothetical protein [Saprospiraceae bacterium]